jgi:hypothetical protein
VGGLTSARAKNRDVEIAIGVSVVAHVLLLMWVVWELAVVMSERMSRAEEVKPEEELTLLYPEQILPEPPAPPPVVPKPEEKSYIRTTQNARSEEAPKQADFVSDRNTKAASELPADEAGKKNMPSLDGIDPERGELASRDYKDGEIKEDGATPVPAMQMAQGAPAVPLDPVQKPVEVVRPPAPPPAPPPSPPPAPALPEKKVVEVAKAVPLTPLEAMMREQDEGEAARLSVEPAPKPKEVVPDQPPVKESPVPEMRTVETPPAPPTPPTPPEMRQPEAVGGAALDPVKRTAGPQDADAFSPFTRTSKVKGTISNRGETAVDAAETPVGRYMRQVTGAVEKKWHFLRRRNADAVTYGSLRLKFFVRADGRVAPPTVLSDRAEADVRMLDFTLRAIMEAEIPPIPADLLPLLDGERLEVEDDVLIY